MFPSAGIGDCQQRECAIAVTPIPVQRHVAFAEIVRPRHELLVLRIDENFELQPWPPQVRYCVVVALEAIA